MFKKFMQIASGPIMGQGVFFLLTLFLAYNGLTPQVANISIAIGVLSLIQWCADGGGVFLLGRYYAKNILSEIIGTLYLVRLFYSVVIFSILYWLLPLFYHNVFLHNVIRYSLVICILGAANISGLADFLGKNKIIGPFASLPWLLVTLYIAYEYFNGQTASFILSPIAIVISYTSGFALSLIVQYYVCNKFLDISQLTRFPYKKIVLKEVGGYFFSYFLSQSYARLLPILVDMFLGKSTAGLFAIAKTFLNIFSQLLMFLRRVENERIIRITEDNNSCSEGRKCKVNLFLELLSMSWKTSKFILAASVSSIIFMYIVVSFVPNISEKISVIWWFISISLSSLVVWNYSSILGQSYIVTGKTTEYAIILFVSLAINISINLLLFPLVGLWSIIIAEILMYLSQILIFIVRIKNQERDKCHAI